MRLRAWLLLPLLLFPACYSGTHPPRVGNAAPDFTLKDSDRTVSLHDLRGKPVLLNFWATWCPPCVEEMPSLVKLQGDMKGKITVLAVSVDVDEAAYHKFLKDHKVDLLTVRDPDQKTNEMYGTFKFPETYVIDKNGVVIRKFIGPVSWTDRDVLEYLNKL